MPRTDQGTGYQGADTSRRAAEKLDSSGRKISLKNRVLAIISEHGPITNTEIAQMMGEWEYSVRPRTSELLNDGKVRESLVEGESKRKCAEKKWELDKVEDHCPACGLVDPNHCGSIEDMEGCPHMKIKEGPMAGLPINHYKVIYADPPWSYKTYSNRDQGTVPHRTDEAPYRAMTAEELLELPVDKVAAKDCVLHMWVISSHIDQAMTLAAKWGFTFKSLGLVWVKTQKHNPEVPKMGMGKWFRQEVEFCLLFTCGKPSRESAGVRQTIIEPAREHSRKPDEAAEKVEALSAGPYLEMFSRSSREGWDVMGDQAGKFDPISPEEQAEIDDLF